MQNTENRQFAPKIVDSLWKRVYIKNVGQPKRAAQHFYFLKAEKKSDKKYLYVHERAPGFFAKIIKTEEQNCFTDFCFHNLKEDADAMYNYIPPMLAEYLKKEQQKKRPSGANIYTNEMTLELPHLSPTVKQGSFLFDFSI